MFPVSVSSVIRVSFYAVLGGWRLTYHNNISIVAWEKRALTRLNQKKWEHMTGLDALSQAFDTLADVMSFIRRHQAG